MSNNISRRNFLRLSALGTSALMIPSAANALEAPAQAKVTAIPDGMSEDEFIDKFIEAQIEWEKEMWGDDDPTAGFLPYEQ